NRTACCCSPFTSATKHCNLKHCGATPSPWISISSRRTRSSANLEAAGLTVEEVIESEPYAPEVAHQSRRVYIFAPKPDDAINPAALLCQPRPPAAAHLSSGGRTCAPAP